jgi:hypothetical protein
MTEITKNLDGGFRVVTINGHEFVYSTILKCWIVNGQLTTQQLVDKKLLTAGEAGEMVKELQIAVNTYYEYEF